MSKVRRSGHRKEFSWQVVFMSMISLSMVPSSASSWGKKLSETCAVCSWNGWVTSKGMTISDKTVVLCSDRELGKKIQHFLEVKCQLKLSESGRGEALGIEVAANTSKRVAKVIKERIEKGARRNGRIQVLAKWVKGTARLSQLALCLRPPTGWLWVACWRRPYTVSM